MIKINCDLCGKVDEKLFRTLIENVELNVCSDCSKFGKVIASVHRPGPKEQHMKFVQQINPQEKEERIELFVENYADLIKKKRESMGLSQKDFALKINEKESTIHKIETGIFHPNIALAKRLEKFLGIKLIEEHQETHEKSKKSKGEGFTIGDFIKLDK